MRTSGCMSMHSAALHVDVFNTIYDSHPCFVGATTHAERPRVMNSHDTSWLKPYCCAEHRAAPRKPRQAHRGGLRLRSEIEVPIEVCASDTP